VLWLSSDSDPAFVLETGGRVIDVGNNGKKLEAAFKQIEDELRTQYLASYTPTNATLDGGYRHVDVQCKGDGLKVQARKGYYALTYHGRLSPKWESNAHPGQSGYGGGMLCQLQVPGKGLVLASTLNGSYGEAAWTPIRYVNRAYSRGVLAGLYRSARAALVTPLRDGMNLVAKEYIAAQDARDPGVLILSRFAGAAAELTAALLVNPYDPEAVATSISHALSIPIEERRTRHKALFHLISKNDLKSWGENFLRSLTGDPDLPLWQEHLGLRPLHNSSLA
jgi:hypothetical protein